MPSAVFNRLTSCGSGSRVGGNEEDGGALPRTLLKGLSPLRIPLLHPLHGHKGFAFGQLNRCIVSAWEGVRSAGQRALPFGNPAGA